MTASISNFTLSETLIVYGIRVSNSYITSRLILGPPIMTDLEIATELPKLK
jgi:hypothetical protein